MSGRDPLPFPPLNAKRTRARAHRLARELEPAFARGRGTHGRKALLLAAYWSHLDRLEGAS